MGMHQNIYLGPFITVSNRKGNSFRFHHIDSELFDKVEPHFCLAIAKPGYEILVSNKKGIGRWVEREEEFVLDIETYETDDDIEHFKSVSADAIKILENFYEYVDFSYGLIKWYD